MLVLLLLVLLLLLVVVGVVNECAFNTFVLLINELIIEKDVINWNFDTSDDDDNSFINTYLILLSNDGV